MKKIIKYALFGFGGIILIALLLAAYFAATFDPNDYKQEVIDLVKKEKNRTLNIDGDIKLTYWPKMGADLGKISISEHASDKTFASVNSVKVALAVMPLLSNKLVVDTIYIDGATANIIKNKDGSNNFDDLLSSQETSESEAVEFNVQGINITNSALSYVDETNGSKYDISAFTMKSGHIAVAEPIDLETSFKVTANQPVVDADISLKGNFLSDPETKHFKVKGLNYHIAGDIAGGTGVELQANGDVDAKLNEMEFLVDGLTVVASGNFNGANQSVDLSAPAINVQNDKVSSNKVTVSFTEKKQGSEKKVNMVLADMSGSPTAVKSSGITGDLSLIEGKRTVTGKFSSPFSGNIENLIFDIPKLVGNLDIKDPSLPNGQVKGTFNISANTDVNKELANSQFNLVLDDTKLNGDVAVSGFKKQNVKFNLSADKLDLNKLLGQSNKSTAAPAKTSKASNSQAIDASALDTLNVNGKLNIGTIVYDKYVISGLNVGVKANRSQLALTGLNVKLDDSQIKGAFSVSQFKNPLYTFDLNIDQLNLDKYVTEEGGAKTAETKTTSNTGDTALDLSALKTLNANGSVKIGKLSYGKTKASNVRVDLKADGGVATLQPFSANLYKGSMNGSLKVDARSTPSIAFKQNMKSVSIGPMMSDAINNDMLSGTGTVNIDVSTQGQTVGALKKALAGNAALNLADGAIKGIDIAGNIRDLKSKVNVFKNKDTVDGDSSKKTDFSELTATFNIKNGVAHNDDLAMKAPILRLAKGNSKGDIDIANEKIDYIAKPTIVKSLKGQGGEDVKSLAGIPIPIKISGTFANPKYGMDYSAVAKGLAQSKLLDKVGGEKGEAVKELLNGDNKVDALKGLLGKKKKSKSGDTAKEEAAPKKKKSSKDKAKEGLKDLLKF